MAYSIRFSLRSVVKNNRLTEEDGQQLASLCLSAVTNAVEREWKQAARKDLKSSRENYVNSINVVSSGRLKNSIILSGSLNNMLESGASSFDIKNGFQKSKKAKISAKGNWYIRIPFRWATPSALGESSAFQGIMPLEIYKVVKKLASHKTEDKRVKSGKSLKADKIPKPYNEKITNKTSGYTHKTSIYEGIMKSKKTYEKASQSKYSSFRSAGAVSDIRSWNHPGLRARKFADLAIENTQISDILDNTINEFLNQK